MYSRNLSRSAVLQIACMSVQSQLCFDLPVSAMLESNFYRTSHGNLPMSILTHVQHYQLIVFDRHETQGRKGQLKYVTKY